MADQVRTYVLFETYEDISSEYKLNKITYNAAEAEKLLNPFLASTTIAVAATATSSVGNEKLACVGFVGGKERIPEACKHYLELSTEDIRTVETKLYQKNEGLLVVTKDRKVAFVYRNVESVFNTGPLSSSLLAIDYVRYMLDICEKIIVMPPAELEWDPAMTKPFQDSANTYVQLQERSVRPNEIISIMEINKNQSSYNLSHCDTKCTHFCRQQLNVCSHDHQRYLYSYHLREDIELTRRQNSVNTKDLENALIHSKDILIDYDRASRTAQEKWMKQSYFQNFKQRSLNVFQCFVFDHKQREFEDLLTNIVNAYDNLVARKLREKEKRLAKKVVKVCQLHSCSLKFSKKHHGFFSHVASTVRSIFDISEEPPSKFELDYRARTERCSDICLTLYDILKRLESSTSASDRMCDLKQIIQDLDEDSLSCRIHYEHRFSIQEKIRQAWRDCVQTGLAQLQDELEETRRSSLQNMLNWLNENTHKTDETHRFELNILFYECSPIVDVEGNVVDYKITRKGFEIKQRLPLGANEKPKDVSLSQVICVTDKIGYFNFSNWPNGRSSLYYFNFANPSYAEIELQQKLLSPETRLIIDEKANIYLIYDNLNRRAERGKLDERTGRLQAPTPVSNLYGQTIEDLVIADGDAISTPILNHISTICFLQGNDSVLLFDQSFSLIEYRYLSGTLKFICKRVNQDTYIKKISLKPADGKYTQVSAVPGGKCILLQCEKSLDIYDLTWSMIGSIPIHDTNLFSGYKTFADQTNTYVVLNEHTSECYVYLLRGLSAARTLDIERASVEQLKGFPLLDIFYLAQRKFGPSSDCIGCPRKTQITLMLPSDLLIKEDKIDTYFTQLFIIGMCLQIESLTDPDYKNIFRRLPQIQISDFKQILGSRVPIHVATIEESNMFPLQDGKNITDEIAAWKSSKDTKTGLVQRITELIRIGAYETILQNCQQKVKVTAIVGRQSGGKSYLLNRLTGTRFNVAATRCTDGIWMSVTFVDGQPLIVLDCEGLFSTRRNDLEEMKLCLTLSALTDILLLNQDLSFNRYLTQLFSNFSKSCDRMKGSNLFKGFLMMVIRDVSTQDADGAYTELVSNIRQQAANNRSSYLQKLFGGKIRGQCLHHFENRVFVKEIEDMRKLILELPFRWNSGQEFLESLKLTLAQVHTDDDTVMDVHRLKMSFSRLEREAHTMLIQGGSQFSTCGKCIIKIQKLTGETGEEEIIINQEKINFVAYLYNDESTERMEEDDELARTALLFFDLISEHFKCNYNESYHNVWFTNVDNVLKQTLEHRIQFILSYVQQQMPTTEATYAADIKDFEVSLKGKLDLLYQKSKICIRECRRCKRLCVKHNDHRDDCNCETDHLCKEPCELCTLSYLCCKLYGHDNKHHCNGGHVCGKPCTVTSTCTMFCALDSSHEVHDCLNRHYCTEKCSQHPQCDKICSYDIRLVHEEHYCGEQFCPYTCSIEGCRQRCRFKNHFHQNLIANKQENELKVLLDGSVKEHIINYHICSNEHACIETCIQPGVCGIGYDIVEKEWTNEMNTFPYKFYEPKPARSKCVLAISLKTRTHAGVSHNCKIDHRCGHQCPECRSFCQLPHSHPEPYHMTNTHRNKECNVFVTKHDTTSAARSVVVKTEGKSREYKPGESCKPEICSESCERKGRTHFHLKLCLGADECCDNLYPYVKHSREQWYPFTDRVYDLWLCEAYWHSLGWEVPYTDDVSSRINSCSYYCSHPTHVSDTQSFCTQTAWHTNEHTFACKHDSFDKLYIVFCCDTTGSMSTYIEESKQTIQRIIESAKAIKDVQFRFVAYRDHPPQDTTYVQQSNPDNLTTAVVVTTFINTLTADGGGNGPEAVLDGLNEAVINTRWRDSTTLKYIVHIADSPPHGSIYTGGSGDHWPGGCPCGLTIEKISDALNAKNIRYKLMKIGSYPNTMASIFRTHIRNYEESDLTGALDLSTKFVGILARDLQAEEIDVVV